MKKTKVLFAINCMNIGGAPSVVFHQIQLLDKKQFEPHLLLLYKSKPANFLSQINSIPSSHIYQFHYSRINLIDVVTFLKIYRHIRKQKYDVVYTHLFLSNLIVRFIAIVTGVKCIITFEHSLYFNKKRWQIMVDRILARWTKFVVVSTTEVALFTEHQQRLRRNQCIVIRNPVTVPERNSIDTVSYKRRLNILQSDCIFVTVGRFAEVKGQALLLKSINNLSGRLKNVKFLFVGHGPSREKLCTLIEEYGLTDLVTLIDEPEKAKDFLYVADCFILPSLREGQGMAAEEALRAGIPVISANLEGMGSLIQNGYNGLLFEPGDAEGLASCIDRFVYETDLRSSLSQGVTKTREGLQGPEEGIKILESLFKSSQEKS